MRYFGYMRVSTETQSEKGYGLETQREEIEKYAKANEIEIADYYTDAGISGNIKDTDADEALNKRVSFMELLATLSDGDTVIVLNTSRLWRSDMTKAIVRRELMKRNGRVISIEQPKYDLYSKDPNDYLINAIMEALDVYERMSISLKLARGRTIKAKGGDKPAGVPPYGYKYTEDRKHITINEAEAPFLKAMFTMGQQGYTLSQIAKGLEDKGARTRHGKLWSRGSVQAVLRNRFYIGELTHQGKVIKGNHEPLISRVQFGKVNAQLEKRQRI